MLLSPAVHVHFTRRSFTASLTGLAAATLLRAQASSNVNPATIEGPHILAAAPDALKQPITPFRNNAASLRLVSNTVATLTAALILTHDEESAARYALRAGQHLYALLVDPATRLAPNLRLTTPAALTDAAPLAELIRCLPFLADTAALSPPDLTTAQTWLADLQSWLSTDRNAIIAREAKDHTAATWLIISSCIARTLRDESTLNANRHRFKTLTLRNQINSRGELPHEAATAFPYRNTLFTFDLLAATCQLLSTPLESIWPFELEDGPGMRSLAASLFPLIKDRAIWPHIADPQNFRDVPTHRPALLFAGRAFNRPDYVDLYRATPFPNLATLPEPIAAAFPITQPLLFIARAPHGL